MRRNLLLAVAAGTLLLGACSDQTPTEPAVPPPSETFGSRCNVPRFPLLAIANQIKAIYPATPRAQALLRAEALLRAGAIKLAWDTCHPVIARKVAFAFIDWLNRHTPPNKETQVHDLIVAILRAVGVVGPAAEGDFGVGFFDPDSDENTVITTENHRALIELVPGSFLVPTVIVISRVAGDPPLTGFDGNQYPPTYDYNAINSTNTHALAGGHTAIVAFCLVVIGPPTMEGNGYAANLAIGHNPFGGGFEILESVDIEDTGLRNQLTCPGIDDVIGSAGGGLQNFANAALRTAGSLLLPPPLWASALGKLPPPPPLSGKAPSLSPFKPVEVARQATTTHITSDVPDPSDPDQSYTVSFAVTASSGTPTGTVQVVDGNEGSCTASVAVGSCVLPPSPAGAHTLTALYLGNSSFASSSDTETHTVAAPTITFASDPTWSESQNVCLNPRIPGNCPEGATVYTSETTGWGADLSSIPGAFWIWSAGVTPETSPAYPAEFSVSKSFSLLGSQLEGSISVAADDYAQVAVNGEVVGEIGSRTDGTLAGAAQNSLTTFDLGSFLVSGTNLITVRGANGTFGCGAGPYSCNPAGVVFGGWLGRAP